MNILVAAAIRDLKKSNYTTVGVKDIFSGIWSTLNNQERQKFGSYFYNEVTNNPANYPDIKSANWKNGSASYDI